MPKVSVIIPVWNAESTIDRCVRSILNSDYPSQDMEVICVDNASTDGTAKILQQFLPSIRVIEERIRGSAAARNAGIREANGGILVFTDADCFVHQDWVRHMVHAVENGSVAVGGRILARPEAGPVERFGEIIHDHSAAIEYYLPPYLIGMNIAFPAEYVRSVGMFDERWLRMQDCDLSMRILRHGGTLTYCDDAIVYHHNRDTLRKLMREGYIHGLYTPAFHLQHGDFSRAYCQERKTGERRPSRVPSPQLQTWQRDLFQWLFRVSKSYGKWFGRFSPPVK